MPQTLAELGVTHKQSMKWQRLARMAETTPAKFDAYVQATISRVIAIFNVDGTTDNHRALGTGENEWYTPLPYLQAARRVMNNIDLDPASSAIAQRTVHAAHYFDLDTDGLAQDWYGNVWLNPPYAQPAISHFADKAIAELDAGHVTQMIVLTHNYTDTAWWHRLAAHANAICFTRGRIAFLDAHGNAAAPTQGQTFCYYGARRMAFGETFAPYGHVMVNP